ncbi:hypothetical protein [Streptomyces griseocarneus]|uniref:hypothetical protein n=1 Tax=Streptomyces griseocarneus TaxID=51201 RepID=UPI00167D1859|nr:hypothetical protein [Streptomyces griseocarneus]MBZ6476224.1 hypothetical protein [Streptomyces griseocarneus]GHG63274.1 hypothetical protein GCM10018779_32720 [Streptomyces griseocarneus]
MPPPGTAHRDHPAIPPAAGAHILIISGNPHTERTLSDITRTARATGRDDLTLHPAGTSAPDLPWRLELCLGEIARLLHHATHTAATTEGITATSPGTLKH